MLSVMQPSMDRDFCGVNERGCDLSKCSDTAAAAADPDACEISVRLPGGATYFVFVYGISQDESPGWTLTLEWKPPSTCVFKSDGCMGKAVQADVILT